MSKLAKQRTRQHGGAWLGEGCSSGHLVASDKPTWDSL